MIDRWRRNDHDVLIFYGRDMTYLPEKMLRIVSEDYLQVGETATLTVFSARSQAEIFRGRIMAK